MGPGRGRTPARKAAWQGVSGGGTSDHGPTTKSSLGTTLWRGGQAPLPSAL